MSEVVKFVLATKYDGRQQTNKYMSMRPWTRHASPYTDIDTFSCLYADIEWAPANKQTATIVLTAAATAVKFCNHTKKPNHIENRTFFMNLYLRSVLSHREMWM